MQLYWHSRRAWEGKCPKQTHVLNLTNSRCESCRGLAVDLSTPGRGTRAWVPGSSGVTAGTALDPPEELNLFPPEENHKWWPAQDPCGIIGQGLDDH